MEYRYILGKLVDGISLSITEAEELALKIMNGEVPDYISSALLVALRIKGEGIEEIVGFVNAMKKMMKTIDRVEVIDVVGTGGDGFSTINVSTATALLVSITHPVAKHGNRAVSGKSGSADVLEALGYRIEVDPETAVKLLRETGFVFLYAPLYHPAMKRVSHVRKALGIRTIFNILGPLTNPAKPRKIVIGVFSNTYARKVAEAVCRMGYERAFIINGEPGIDEVSTCGLTHVYEVRGQSMEYYTLTPEDFGVKPIPITNITASSPEESASRLLKASKGLDIDVATFIKMNAALALVLTGYADDFRDGFEYAGQLLPNLIGRVEDLVKSNGDVKRLKIFMERVL